ncbi:MAG: hypothetical protein AB7O95_15385, partial [Geminicoccaceae bacterium]
PFPNYDYAERAEMASTIPFPSPESPDYRPPELPGKDRAPRLASRTGRPSLWRRLLRPAGGQAG